MPEYIRHVSVYTGPELFPKLKDQYVEARDRMTRNQNFMIIKDEDIRPEDSDRKCIQLHSHLLFSVTVDNQDAPDCEIIDHAMTIIARCLDPDLRANDPSEIGGHPLFKYDGEVSQNIPECEWSPAETDLQFLAYPRSCAEDLESKRVRQQRLRDFGDAHVTYRRDSLGNTTSTVEFGSNSFIYNSDPNVRYVRTTVIEHDVVFNFD